MSRRIIFFSYISCLQFVVLKKTIVVRLVVVVDSHNDVVEQRDFQYFASVFNIFGKSDVGFARLDNSCWMVVSYSDGDGVFL